MNGKNTLIPRTKLVERIQVALSESPVTALIGARQTGKTTLARMVTSGLRNTTWFDLERAADRQALTTPELTLESLNGIVVIDEVQRMPELYMVLRPLCDRPGNSTRFLILGSASSDLVRGVSETLAGRITFVNVPGFTLNEISSEESNRLWTRGGFPRSFLSDSEAASMRWRESFIMTFLERDIPGLGFRIPSETLRRFLVMTAHYHGQIWNGSEIARSMGMTHKTVRNYLDLFAGTYILRILSPWYENLKKRQVKSPRIYYRDSGILHYLLGIDSMGMLRSNPKYGASWEGYTMDQILQRIGERNTYFWRTQHGAELDLFVIRGNKRYGFEFKCNDSPGITRSMKTALEDLNLNHLFVVYPGLKSYNLHDKISTVSVPDLCEFMTGSPEADLVDRYGFSGKL